MGETGLYWYLEPFEQKISGGNAQRGTAVGGLLPMAWAPGRGLQLA